MNTTCSTIMAVKAHVVLQHAANHDICKVRGCHSLLAPCIQEPSIKWLLMWTCRVVLARSTASA